MKIKLNVVSKGQPGITGGGILKYYPQIISRQKLKTNDVCKKIEKASSLSEPDIKAVISAFTYFVPQLLLEGHTVELEDFGIFSLYIKAEGNADANEVRLSNIREARLHFRPAMRVKKMLKDAQFTITDRKI